MNKMKCKYWSLLASVGFAAGLLYAPSLVLAATSPTLSAALSYSVLAGSIVTNSGPTTVNRDLGVSPSIGAPPHVTGFPPGTVGPPGTIHDADANAALAQLDNGAAFLALSAAPNVACTTTFAGVKDLVGLTLVPGIYCADAFELSGTLTLNDTSAPNGVWIFRSAATLTTSAGVGAKVQFLNGIGSPCNVWWKEVSSAVIGSGTTFIGNILASTAISLGTGASLNGRALAQTAAVTLLSNTITTPLCQAATTTTTSPPGSTTTTTLQGSTTTTTLQGSTTTTLQGSTTTTLQGSTTTTIPGTTSTTIVRIPAAGNWGMVILALAFLGAIAWVVRARRSLR
jgi:hypothetical protein